LPPVNAKKPNDLWSMDFMLDSLINGRRIKILTLVDHYSRYCPSILVHPWFSEKELYRAFERIIAVEGELNAILSDNGTEFTAK